MASLVSSMSWATRGLVSLPCDSRTKCSGSQARAELMPSASQIRRQQVGFGLGQGCCFSVAPALRGRRASVRRRAGGDDEEPGKRGAGSSESKFDDTVDEIQQALGKSFGGPLWFAVLLTLLALFGGGYVYLIYNYAEFSDIPILNGPQDF